MYFNRTSSISLKYIFKNCNSFLWNIFFSSWLRLLLKYFTIDFLFIFILPKNRKVSCHLILKNRILAFTLFPLNFYPGCLFRVSTVLLIIVYYGYYIYSALVSSIDDCDLELKINIFLTFMMGSSEIPNLVFIISKYLFISLLHILRLYFVMWIFYDNYDTHAPTILLFLINNHEYV